MEALTHSSFSHENNLNYDYERLEFLGDAVLELIASEYILNNYRDMDEGAMSRLRSYVVNEKFLSGIARRLNIGGNIFLGKGEAASSGRDTDSILADIFEAVTAAVYMDGGYSKARDMAVPLLKDGIEEAAAGSVFLDEKGEVQKLSQKNYGALPVYSVIGETGPDHHKTFTVRLEIGGAVSVTGRGRSKKLAEKDAAAAALRAIREK